MHSRSSSRTDASRLKRGPGACRFASARGDGAEHRVHRPQHAPAIINSVTTNTRNAIVQSLRLIGVVLVLAAPESFSRLSVVIAALIDSYAL